MNVLEKKIRNGIYNEVKKDLISLSLDEFNERHIREIIWGNIRKNGRFKKELREEFFNDIFGKYNSLMYGSIKKNF